MKMDGIRVEKNWVTSKPKTKWIEVIEDDMQRPSEVDENMGDSEANNTVSWSYPNRIKTK